MSIRQQTNSQRRRRVSRCRAAGVRSAPALFMHSVPMNWRSSKAKVSSFARGIPSFHSSCSAVFIRVLAPARFVTQSKNIYAERSPKSARKWPNSSSAGANCSLVQCSTYDQCLARQSAAFLGWNTPYLIAEKTAHGEQYGSML